ncbi:hypothetical protein [Shimia sp.]|uniref:hypothetical protein n=1 Tax=Shimia sp. TaxID=1954381 RepID=UPI0035646AA3
MTPSEKPRGMAPRDAEPVTEPEADAATDRPAPEVAISAAPPNDRLVLTPALRVVGAEASTTGDETAALDDEDESDASLAETLSFLRGTRDWEAEAGQGESADAPQTRVVDAELDPAPAAGFASDREPQVPQEDAPDHDLDGDATRSLFDEDGGIALSDAQSLDSRLVQWEHMTDADILAYEPDAPGDSDYAGTEIASLGWVGAASRGSQGVDDDEADDESAAPAPEAAATQKAAAEAGEGPDRMAPEAVFSGVRDQVEAEVFRAFDAAVTQSVSSVASGDDTAESDLLLDETMLRELVSDIVRQELQGTLGERITRNVRKLVRREIHRALAAHDLN